MRSPLPERPVALYGLGLIPRIHVAIVAAGSGEETETIAPLLTLPRPYQVTRYAVPPAPIPPAPPAPPSPRQIRNQTSHEDGDNSTGDHKCWSTTSEVFFGGNSPISDPFPVIGCITNRYDPFGNMDSMSTAQAMARSRKAVYDELSDDEERSFLRTPPPPPSPPPPSPPPPSPPPPSPPISRSNRKGMTTKAHDRKKEVDGDYGNSGSQLTGMMRDMLREHAEQLARIQAEMKARLGKQCAGFCQDMQESQIGLERMIGNIQAHQAQAEENTRILFAQIEAKIEQLSVKMDNMTESQGRCRKQRKRGSCLRKTGRPLSAPATSEPSSSPPPPPPLPHQVCTTGEATSHRKLSGQVGRPNGSSGEEHGRTRSVVREETSEQGRRQRRSGLGVCAHGEVKKVVADQEASPFRGQVVQEWTWHVRDESKNLGTEAQSLRQELSRFRGEADAKAAGDVSLQPIFETEVISLI